MDWLRHRGKQGILSRSGKGLVLLFLFASVLTLANSATLHRTLHANATAPDHHCVVTLLANGQVDVSSSVATAAAPSTLVILAIFADLSCETGICFNLPLSRGPPALLS